MKGRIIRIISQISPSCTANYGEALAAQLAFSLAATLKLRHFIIEGDSQIVIMALQHPQIPQDWRIMALISDTLESIFLM
jgi:ribonuclease HI